MGRVNSYGLPDYGPLAPAGFDPGGSDRQKSWHNPVTSPETGGRRPVVVSADVVVSFDADDDRRMDRAAMWRLYTSKRCGNCQRFS